MWAFLFGLRVVSDFFVVGTSRMMLVFSRTILQKTLSGPYLPLYLPSLFHRSAHVCLVPV